jgi:hypothetical protein
MDDPLVPGFRRRMSRRTRLTCQRLINRNHSCQVRPRTAYEAGRRDTCSQRGSRMVTAALKRELRYRRLGATASSPGSASCRVQIGQS